MLSVCSCCDSNIKVFVAVMFLVISAGGFAMVLVLGLVKFFARLRSERGSLQHPTGFLNIRSEDHV